MKKHLISLLVLTLTAGASLALAQHPKTHGAKETPAEGNHIKRGAPLGNSPAVALEDVLKEPQKYTGKTYRISGVIERNCTSQGCWMELAPKAGAAGIRVTFQGHAFFIPLNSKGWKAQAEGQFTIKVLSKDEADHLAGEGAKLNRNADGTANEVSFLATGVELSK